jgi:CO/xanthine dehydrogenase FAD-binding subunit
LRSVNGDRLIEIKDFIQGPRKVQRLHNEILVEIILPSALENGPHIVFEKIANRRADAIAKISFAGFLHLQNDVITDARFAFGAVGPTTVRSLNIEQILYGKAYPLEDKLIDAIITDYSNLIHPIDDQRSTAVYRKTVALNLLRYFLETHGRK